MGLPLLLQWLSGDSSNQKPAHALTLIVDFPDHGELKGVIRLAFGDTRRRPRRSARSFPPEARRAGPIAKDGEVGPEDALCELRARQASYSQRDTPITVLGQLRSWFEKAADAAAGVRKLVFSHLIGTGRRRDESLPTTRRSCASFRQSLRQSLLPPSPARTYPGNGRLRHGSNPEEGPLFARTGFKVRSNIGV